jgi:hypothetical protein
MSRSSPSTLNGNDPESIPGTRSIRNDEGALRLELNRSRLSFANLPRPSNNIRRSARQTPPVHAKTAPEIFMTNPIPASIPNRHQVSRAEANRTNALHSTGPRTPAGKQRSSRNAVTHGLTAASPVLSTEDPAAYQIHCRQYFDEYQPATPTESHLTQQLADTAWRLNRVPLLEAALLDRAANPPTQQAAISFDIVDAYRALATLGMHSQRLSRQFQKLVDMLREIQAERRLRQERDLKRAAALLELHKHKGIPYDPVQDGFVFSKDEIEAYSQRLMRLNHSRHIEDVLFHMQPPIQREAVRAAAASYQSQEPRR